MIIPVILSGGSGTRLWPISRALYPKQLIRGLVTPDESLLGATLMRLASEPDVSAPIITSNIAHRFLVKEECERAGITPAAIMLEPVSRNTAPAIAMAAFYAVAKDPDAVLAVMPSDHVLEDTQQFRAEVRHAADVAARGKIVLFGIRPIEPHTGYGYIRCGKPLDDEAGGAFAVSCFTEKPDRGTAAAYIAAGDYLWNSGIFVFRADVFLEELASLAPGVFEAARGAVEGAVPDHGFLHLDAAQLAEAPSVSVDYAVMEKTHAAAVIPLDIGWNDLGSWSALWDIASRDSSGNFVRGDALLEDTRNCYVHSERALVSTIGLEDLVIVETPDTVLVAHMSRSQDVSRIVARLQVANRSEHEHSVRRHRPWGYIETLNLGARFRVKHLHVKPGGLLSLQSHHHRSAHWVVVQGTAKVTVDGRERLVRENESVNIVAAQWHRLQNPGKIPLELIEVQVGARAGEDDYPSTHADETR